MLCQGPPMVLRSSSPGSAKQRKRPKPRWSSTLRGDWGRGVEEVLESSLHALDACLSLLLSYLVGKGNMGEPALSVCERGMKEWVHGVMFDVMPFTNGRSWSPNTNCAWRSSATWSSAAWAVPSIVWSWTTQLQKTHRLWEIARRWVTTPVAQEEEVQWEETLVKW